MDVWPVSFGFVVFLAGIVFFALIFEVDAFHAILEAPHTFAESFHQFGYFLAAE